MRGGVSVGLIIAALAGCELGREPSFPDAVPDADDEFPYPPPRTDLVPPLGAANTIEIATWNLENFPDQETTPSVVADLIASLDLDVVVVEEIASNAAWDELVARLRDHEGILSTHQYSPTSYQKIGVIYRSALVTASPPQLLFVEDGWAFPRPPLSVTVTIDSASIELVGLHLKAGVGFEDADRRRLAIAALEARVRAQVDTGGEAEVIVLGDYNEIVTDTEGRDVMAPLLVAPDRYTVRTEPLATAGQISYLGFGGKFIDHITTTAALDVRWPTVRTEVPRLQDMIGSYTSLVSDHIPAILIAPR